MKKHFYKAVIYVLLTLLLTHTAHSQSSEQVRAEINRLEIQWHDVYKTRDTGMLLKILSPRFVHINRNGNKSGRKEEIEGLKGDNAVYEQIYPYDMQYTIYPSTVVVVGKTKETGMQNGKPFNNDYFWTDIFEKTDYGWQATLAQTSILPKSNVFISPDLSQKDTSITGHAHRLIKDLAKEDKFSGVVLIAKKNSVIFQSAFGNANKDFNVSNTFQTIFNLASMTKMFTGVAIAQLAGDKKLAFDDPVKKFLPELPANLTGGITIRQLLLHTSGLNQFWTAEFHNSNHASYRTLKDYIPLILQDKPSFLPGSKWQYSNTGYLLLGLVIEKISGMTYFDYVKENIFKKAGMDNTAFYEADIPNRNMASGYTTSNRYLENYKGYTNPIFLAPVKGSSAGGAYATAEDLHKFYMALYDHRLLSKELTDTVVAGKFTYDKPELRKSYGFGFANQYLNNKLIVFHDGGASGISTIMDMYPTEGYAVIVLSNYDAPAAWSVAKKLRELITL